MKLVSFEESREIMLEMLIHFDHYCRENKLNYSLAGGTLLGAIRHKGYIPWDDDIDVFMPREDYKRFVKAYDRKKYNLITCEKGSKWIFAYSRLTDYNTEVFSNETDSLNHGLWVAILPIDGFPETDEEWMLTLRKISFWESLARLRNSPWRSYVSLPRNICKKIAQLPLRLIPCHFIGKKIESYTSKIPMFSTSRLANSGTYFVCDKCIPQRFSSECFDGYVEVEFEGHSVMSMRGYEKYLTSVYGDWRQLPPKEQRKPSHNYKTFFIDK